MSTIAALEEIKPKNKVNKIKVRKLRMRDRISFCKIGLLRSRKGRMPVLFTVIGISACVVSDVEFKS
ncbi:MAG: hypothetical protein ACK2UW_00345, partial [Anaerolineales bacterium]